MGDENMALATQLLQNVAPSSRKDYVAALSDPDKLLDRFDITTPLRVCHLLAQVLHETGGGRVLFEDLSYTTAKRLLEIFGIGNHSAAILPSEAPELLRNPQGLAERVYGRGNPAKAVELGNKHGGDGFRYRGGGLLQTTGGSAYERVSQLTGVNYYDSPDLIVTEQHSLKPALYEWGEKNLNASADKNDIRTITKRINGGYNGLDSRRDWFERLWSAAGASGRAWEAAAPDADTTWLQDSLNTLGADPPLVVDGRYGPATTAAVKAFQKLAKVKADGVAGDVTRAAMRLRLATVRAK